MKLVGIAAIIIALALGYYFVIYLPQRDKVQEEAQITTLQKTIKNDNALIEDQSTLLRKITGTNDPFEQAYDADNGIIISHLHPSVSPTPNVANNNPHAGMKEIKGTNCSGQMGTNGGKDINMNCQPYDYWVNPNAPKPTDDPNIWTNIK